MPPVGRRKHLKSRVPSILLYKEIVLGSGQVLQRMGTMIS